MKKLLLTLFLSFVALGAGAADPPLPAGLKKVTTVEGITEYSLPNGLRILIAPDPSKPSTTVNITYMVGSRHENYGETGMAHLLEHLLFKGTPTYRFAMNEMSKRGLRFNGSTWLDRTNYFASWAASDENLDWYLRWSADAMTHSFIARKDLDSEMTVVRNEMEMGENSPFRILLEKTMAAAFQWHSYGKSTIGARADVENVSIERLQAFYRNYYQPDNAVLIVTGKFDEKKTLALIASQFGKIPRPTRKIQPTYTLDPAQDGERSVTLRRVGDTQLVLAAYHIPPGSTPDYASVELLATILGDTPTGRLHKALVEPRIAGEIFGFSFDAKEPGIAFFGARLPNDASLDKARDTLLAVVEGVAQQPLTAVEVERARTKWLKDFELTAADPEKVGVALSSAIAMGDWRIFYLTRDHVRNAKLADVQRVAESYLIASNRTLGLFIPTPAPKRAPAPAFADVQGLVKDYKGDAAVAAGEAFDATPANIDARTKRSRLANGMKVALLPKKTRGTTVNARVNLRFGDEKSLFGTPPLGNLAASMLSRGAEGMTRQEIEDAFDKLKAQVQIGGGNAVAFANIETTRENLPEVLKLVAKVMRKPTFPESEFEQLRTERITGLERQRKEPDALGRIALLRYGNPYPKGDVRYQEEADEAIATLRSVNLQQVKDFYARFYGADSGEVAIVGDFDADATQQLLAQLFGDWKGGQAYARVITPLYEPKPTEIRIETPDKANAIFMARLHFALRDEDPDYAAALLADYIVGGSTGSILWKRIREKEGLSYGVWTAFTASPYTQHGSWTPSAIYAPQNAGKLEAAFREEVQRAYTKGFTAEELKDAKNGLLRERQLELAQDKGLAGTLATFMEQGRTMAFEARIDRDIQAATLEQVNAAFRKYVDPSKLVTVYAGDFAKAAKK